MKSNKRATRKSIQRQQTHHEPLQVVDFEIVGWATAPVDDVLVLTLAALLAAPVGQVEVVVHRVTAEATVLQHCVEKGLEPKTDVNESRNRQQLKGTHTTVAWSLCQHMQPMKSAMHFGATLSSLTVLGTSFNLHFYTMLVLHVKQNTQAAFFWQRIK